MKLSLCIDIGGTHISAAVIDLDTMEVSNAAKVYAMVDSMKNQETILHQWKSAINEVLHKANNPISNICVSIPGPFDYEEGICLMDGMHKYQSLLHMNVKDWFSKQFSIPAHRIHFFNDAEAFLLGELYHSNLFDKKVVGLTIGTGLGSCYYNGQNTQDLNYGSIEFREGIAEDYISTRGLTSYVLKNFGKTYKNVKSIVDDSQAPELCIDTFEYLADSLAQFVNKYIDVLKPDKIILGGSISKSHHLFLNKLQEQTKTPIHIASMDEFNVLCGIAKFKQNNQ